MRCPASQKRWNEGVRPTLPSAGMKFAAIGELAIRPLVALGGSCLRRSGDGCSKGRTPICGCRMNAPDIAGLVESDAYHPALASHPQRHTVRNPGGRTFAGREFVQKDFRSRLQRASEPYPATLGVDHQRVSSLGERVRCVQAGNAKWNLGANSSAAPRFSRLFRRVHKWAGGQKISVGLHPILSLGQGFGGEVLRRSAHQSNQ